MRYKKLMLYICAAITALLAFSIVFTYISNAPFRWSRNLCEAIRLGDTEKALQLIEEGALNGYNMDTLSERPSFIWTLLESTPQTPLQAACTYGNYAVIQQLLEEGASVRPSLGGLTTEPVFCVLRRPYSSDDAQIIQLLIEHGATLCSDSISGSPITDAAYRAPLNFHAAPDPTTGKYLYDETAAKGITDVFLLLSKYCDCYAVNEAGRNALHCAALMGNWNLVNVLATEFSYSLDAQDVNGKTAYDLAKESDAPRDILELLKPK